MPENAVTYRAAGVNIDEAQRALRGVLADIQATYTENVVAGVGGFGGLFHANFPGLEHPVLVSSIDGVGTKTKVAAMVGSYEGLGEDIVNHCVNDILCQGARPLFFLDYFGASRLSASTFEAVVRGAAKACKAAGCALLGGETAEMPGVYTDDEIDVVGSIVGVVDFDKRLPSRTIQQNDAIIGVASDGLHTNGYSLARKVLFEVGGLSVRDNVTGMTSSIGEELLRPHRCYLQAVFPLLLEGAGIKAIAHITGGGLYDNLPRALPPDTQAVIERRAWTPPPIFTMIQRIGDVPDTDMFRTFNMGIGLVLVVEGNAAPGIVQMLNRAGEASAIIGHVQQGAHDVQIV
jgi:phosphoribosylformylglycinamidine cyclo-ligase